MIVTDNNMALEYKVNKHFYQYNTIPNWFIV